MKNKKILIYKNGFGARRGALVLAILVTLSMLLSAPGTFAGETATPAPSNGLTSTDLRNELSNIRESLDSAKVELGKAESELKTLNTKIAELEAQIAQTQTDIGALEVRIAELDAQIADLNAQIAVLEEDIENQNSDLNQRLRMMFEQSDQSMLTVLLDSESFVDFLSNLDMVQRIHESDKAFLAELEAKLDAIEEKRAEVQRIDDQLKAEKVALEDKKALLDEENEVLAAAKARAQQIRDEYNRKVDELEAESKRLQTELANMYSEWGDYSGGAMAWPAIGPITSEFGGRYHPIFGSWRNHDGIDIGVPTGTPIHAATEGIVYSAVWNSGGYGNLVMIDHGVNENGQNIVTLYAHNSGFAVSKGSVVKRGDIIAYAGSTGNSTGPHCHFEVRVGGVAQNPRGWLG